MKETSDTFLARPNIVRTLLLRSGVKYTSVHFGILRSKTSIERQKTGCVSFENLHSKGEGMYTGVRMYTNKFLEMKRDVSHVKMQL